MYTLVRVLIGLLYIVMFCYAAQFLPVTITLLIVCLILIDNMTERYGENFKTDLVLSDNPDKFIPIELKIFKNGDKYDIQLTGKSVVILILHGVNPVKIMRSFKSEEYMKRFRVCYERIKSDSNR